MKQLGTRLNALRKISKFADFKTRKMLADGLFMSKLVYLIPLWGGCEKFLIKALQIIQNKAARSVTKQGIFTPVQLLLKQCGWLSVHQLVFFHTLVLLFKTNQNKTPQYLFDMTSSDLNYKTRAENPGKLRIDADSYQNRASTGNLTNGGLQCILTSFHLIISDSWTAWPS